MYTFNILVYIQIPSTYRCVICVTTVENHKENLYRQKVCLFVYQLQRDISNVIMTIIGLIGIIILLLNNNKKKRHSQIKYLYSVRCTLYKETERVWIWMHKYVIFIFLLWIIYNRNDTLYNISLAFSCIWWEINKVLASSTVFVNFSKYFWKSQFFLYSFVFAELQNCKLLNYNLIRIDGDKCFKFWFAFLNISTISISLSRTKSA